jgi:uncharacterized protein (UPF0332 family)
MLDDRKLKESSRIIKSMISDEKIVPAKEGSTAFFIDKSRQSIAVASRLLTLESEEGLATDMWVINTSYYSMFFAATSLLAHHNHRIDSEQGIHKLTYHALIHFFVVEDKKLEKYFIEEYKDAIDEAEQLLQLSEQKTEQMLTDFENEIAKRKIFTYDLGRIAERKKAETSLKRAKSFFITIEKMIGYPR